VVCFLRPPIRHMARTTLSTTKTGWVKYI